MRFLSAWTGFRVGQRVHESRRRRARSYRLVLVGAVAVFDTAGADAQLPRLEPVLTIGCPACDGAPAFYEIAGITIGPDQHITVLDHGEPNVRVFSASGAVIRAFGRRGRGPGEFMTPSFLVQGRGDTIGVIDVTNRRMTRLDGAGEELSSLPVRDFPVALASAAGDDVVFMALTDFRTPTLAIDVLEGAARQARVLRFTSDFPTGAENQPSAFIAMAASDRRTFAVGDGTADYRIRIYDRQGNVIREFTRDVARVQRSDDEIAVEEARRKRMRSRVQAMRQAESRAAPALNPPAVPKLKAHFLAGAFAFDPLGRLWVRTERGRLDDTVFDVFDDHGRFMGEVRVPARVGFFTIAHGLLAGVTRDADEAQYFTVFRLVG